MCRYVASRQQAVGLEQKKNVFSLIIFTKFGIYLFPRLKPRELFEYCAIIFKFTSALFTNIYRHMKKFNHVFFC